MTTPNLEAREGFIYALKTPNFGELIATCHGEDKLELARLFAASQDLLDSLQWLFGEIESGALVRNIERDGEPDFAIRMMRFVANLGKAQAAIAKAAVAKEGGAQP